MTQAFRGNSLLIVFYGSKRRRYSMTFFSRAITSGGWTMTSLAKVSISLP